VLYELKSSRAAFRVHLAETIYDLGYEPTRADPNAWIRPATKPNGFEYYEMVLVYVDDIRCISYNPRATIEEIQLTFRLKDSKIEKPEHYFGAQLAQKGSGGVEELRTMT
jgi:hypothetical protein